MLTQKQILDAVDAELIKLFPGITVYRNLVPTEFVRPSAMTRLTGQTMAVRTLSTVQRTATVLVTLFCPVDDHHSTDADTLGAQADTVMEHFSAPGLPAAGRVLEIGTVACNPQADFAEVTIPLSWDDDRAVERPAYEMMETLHLEME